MVGIFKLHVPHINIHEGGSREEMIGFSRDDGDSIVGQFSDMSSRGDACYSISDYYGMLHSNSIQVQVYGSAISSYTKKWMNVKRLTIKDESQSLHWRFILRTGELIPKRKSACRCYLVDARYLYS